MTFVLGGIVLQITLISTDRPPGQHRLTDVTSFMPSQYVIRHVDSSISTPFPPPIAVGVGVAVCVAGAVGVAVPVVCSYSWEWCNSADQLCGRRCQ